MAGRRIRMPERLYCPKCWSRKIDVIPGMRDKDGMRLCKCPDCGRDFSAKQVADHSRRQTILED